MRPDDVLGRRRAPAATVVISGDTEPCDATREAARGAAVLVHEATFLDEDRDRARETRHSTAREAPTLAREADVGPAGADAPVEPLRAADVRAEAEAVFPRVLVPRDFDQIEIPFPERGEPVVHPVARRPASGGR